MDEDGKNRKRGRLRHDVSREKWKDLALTIESRIFFDLNPPPLFLPEHLPSKDPS